MRIISGKYRGKNLFPPANRDIRPTSDRTKEALFNILQWNIEGSVFVDFFAGSGAIGIEALSRGAKKVYFVDNDRQSVALINRNLRGIEGNYEIVEKDYLAAVRFIASKERDGVDFVFADPPYKAEVEQTLMSETVANGMLKEDGILIFEHGKNRSLSNGAMFKFDTRNYGIAVLDFFRKAKVGAVTGSFDPFTNGHLFVLEEALSRFDIVHVVFLTNPDKILTFNRETRIEMAKIATEKYADNLVFAAYDGLAIDYMRQNNIKYIVRGIRNEKDDEFERAMADYNRENGGIETIIVTAKDKFISSTEVKARLKEGLDVSDYIDTRLLQFFEVKQ